MKMVTMLADSPQDAVRKARQSFGPQAVIKEVRQQSAKGLSRIWRKPKLELLIQIPEPKTAEKPPETLNLEDESENQNFFQIYQQQIDKTTDKTNASQPGKSQIIHSEKANKWRVEPMLRSMGLSDYWISEILDRLSLRFQNGMPNFVRDELAFCRSLMMELLPAPSADPRESNRPIVLLGTPGCGKTTVLCKWMAHLVFQRNLTPTVWRLDGIQPNTAESLAVYAEMLQAPITRFPENHADQQGARQLFIDLPGISIQDSNQVNDLESRLKNLPDCDRYLVLNACYTDTHLSQQIRAFDKFNPKGIIITHLDEGPQWGKLMNLFLGTNFPVALLSGGQNIPGTFEAFRPSSIISRIFPSHLAA